MRLRMERLGKALCRTDHPTHDAGILRRCADTWAVALDALRTAGDAAPADVARLFDGLCRWRAHRTRWVATGPRSDRRVATHYLLEAAARLSLMDYVHSAGDADVARRAAEVRDVCAVSLAVAETETMLEPFDAVSTEELPALLETVTSRWREEGSAQRERAALAPAAHALLVSSDSESISMAARTSLLVRAARVSTLCAAREILRAITIHRAAAPQPLEGDAAAAIAAWARARSRHPLRGGCQVVHGRAHSRPTGPQPSAPGGGNQLAVGHIYGGAIERAAVHAGAGGCHARSRRRERRGFDHGVARGPRRDHPHIRTVRPRCQPTPRRALGGGLHRHRRQARGGACAGAALWC